MELNRDARIDTSQVEDRRGGGGGDDDQGGARNHASGGGNGSIGGGSLWGSLLVIAVLLVVGCLFGGDLLDDEDSGDNSALSEKCAAPDALDHLDCRNVLYINSIQAYWAEALPEHFGVDYEEAKTVFFDDKVNSACGPADSGEGPFYCPADAKIYIDLTFYQDLADYYEAGGEFAQPYILGHEYGHHVQNLLDDEEKLRAKRKSISENKLSVLVELQADCYSGVWARNATGTTDDDGVKIFKSITARDIDEALETAAAIGDDVLQGGDGKPVDEANFTHGTAAQRQEWFNRGYRSGDPTACDTSVVR
jgi:predicted metalloprotease